MSALRIDVNFAEDAPETDLDIEAIGRKAIEEAINVMELNPNEGAELSVLLCGDATIQQLNREWRKKGKPTNVLSFPNDPEGILLGDIIISLDTVASEAALENKTIKDHVSHLMIHGFLHIFGYDHESDEEADKMESLETEILKRLGIANPYLDKD